MKLVKTEGGKIVSKNSRGEVYNWIFYTLSKILIWSTEGTILIFVQISYNLDILGEIDTTQYLLDGYYIYFYGTDIVTLEIFQSMDI